MDIPLGAKTLAVILLTHEDLRSAGEIPDNGIDDNNGFVDDVESLGRNARGGHID